MSIVLRRLGSYTIFFHIIWKTGLVIETTVCSVYGRTFCPFAVSPTLNAFYCVETES
jgi:hypothetical protein